jgi:hypothetical protein
LNQPKWLGAGSDAWVDAGIITLEQREQILALYKLAKRTWNDTGIAFWKSLGFQGRYINMRYNKVK